MWVPLLNGQLLNLSQCISLRITTVRGAQDPIWRIMAATMSGNMELVRSCASEEEANKALEKLRETLNRRTAR